MLSAGDRRLVFAYLILCLFSLALLWSVTEPIRGPYEDLDPGVPKSIFFRQILWVVTGCFVLAAASRLSLHYLENIAWLLYILVIVLLALVLVVGPPVGGARRWLVLGPLRMQPSEMAKIAFILVSATVLSRNPGEHRQFIPTLTTFVLMAILFILVLKEPDLGSALVFPAIWLGMIFWYGTSGVFLLGVGTAVLSAVISFYSETVSENPLPWGIYLVLLIGFLYLSRFRVLASGIILLGNIAAGIGIPYFWVRLQEYQQERILAFFEPSRDAFGSGYQVIQSKVAIGSGGLFGTHYLQGTQKGLAFLPERHTDFIFSVVGEELGFAGAIALLFLFLVIILRGLELAQTSRRPFSAFLAIGIATYFVFHVVVNVAITIGLLPVTGLPLPLISYGGSNLLTTSFLVGLMINVSSRQFET
jgi:rod shape determining protein RodA